MRDWQTHESSGLCSHAAANEDVTDHVAALMSVSALWKCQCRGQRRRHFSQIILSCIWRPPPWGIDQGPASNQSSLAHSLRSSPGTEVMVWLDPTLIYTALEGSDNTVRPERLAPFNIISKASSIINILRSWNESISIRAGVAACLVTALRGRCRGGLGGLRIRYTLS